MPPAEIEAHLNGFVIGQDDAKRVLSVAVYNHYKRVQYNLARERGEINSVIELKKSNIMMIGPTGSGKTHVTSTLAKIINTPFVSADATVILSSSGSEIDNIIARLVKSANGDIKRAEQGIVYIDEIDKIASRYSPIGERLQQGLLKVIEGTQMQIPYEGKTVTVDTNNILFIVGGAFIGLEQFIGERVHGVMRVGMENEIMKNVVAEDLAKFGMIPEFVGRLPVITILTELNKEALVNILTKPKNSIVVQYKTMLAMDGVELEFDDDALDAVAEKAIEMKTGARGLRTILENKMTDVMYKIPGKKHLSRVRVTRDVIVGDGVVSMDFAHANEDIEWQEPLPKPDKYLKN